MSKTKKAASNNNGAEMIEILHITLFSITRNASMALFSFTTREGELQLISFAAAVAIKLAWRERHAFYKLYCVRYFTLISSDTRGFNNNNGFLHAKHTIK